MKCLGGGTGRRAGFKIRFLHGSESSSLSRGTISQVIISLLKNHLSNPHSNFNRLCESFKGVHRVIFFSGVQGRDSDTSKWVSVTLTLTHRVIVEEVYLSRPRGDPLAEIWLFLFRVLCICERVLKLLHQLTSILPHFLSSLWNETTAASSDGFCTSVVVLNRRVEFASLWRESSIQLEYYQ